MPTNKIDLFSFPYGMKVTCHPYRTSVIYSDDIIFTINRDSDEGKKFEDKLAKMADVQKDNHTGYTCELRGGSKFYVMCTDSSIHIGLKIHIGGW